MANIKNYGAVKMMVRTLSPDATADDMAALLEDIEGKLKDKEEFKQSEIQKAKN